MNNMTKQYSLTLYSYMFYILLIEFIQKYYPEIFSDFNDASVGMMLLELNAAVGDMLSFHTDRMFNETQMFHGLCLVEQFFNMWLLDFCVTILLTEKKQIRRF